MYKKKTYNMYKEPNQNKPMVNFKTETKPLHCLVDCTSAEE